MDSQNIYVTELDKRIIRFLKKSYLLTLATSFNNKSWCCSCFYVYDEKVNKFIFTSDSNTRHISEVKKQPYVSGAIATDTLMVAKIKGVQFTGIMNIIKEEDFNKAKKAYIKRFPVATLATLHLWCIEPDFIKFTDNKLGFGKKMIWQKKS